LLIAERGEREKERERERERDASIVDFGSLFVKVYPMGTPLITGFSLSYDKTHSEHTTNKPH
jgi:hypothetical protein